MSSASQTSGAWPEIVLCFRCEHRARFLDDARAGINPPRAPRSGCGCARGIEGVYSCYTYVPTVGLTVAADAGDERAVGAPWPIAARAHATGLETEGSEG